jgi:hypothetical protein
LTLRHRLGKLLARHVQPLDLGRRHRLFARRPRRLPVDPGQVLFDLRQLVLQRGRLAQQPQNHLPPALDGALALPDLELQSLALLVDLRHPLARRGDLRFQRLHILLVAADLLIQRIQPQPQFLRVLLVLRDTLLDRSAFLYLRGQPPARALRLHLPLRQLLARFGELVLHLVAGHLLALVRLFALRYLVAERLQFAGGDAQFDRRLGRIALQQAVLATQHLSSP